MPPFPSTTLRLALAAGLVLTPAASWAQPDAGQLLNQQQRQTPPLNRPGPVADPATPRGPVAAPDAFRARVDRIRFSGAEGLLPAAELQAAVAGALGRRLSHAELQALAEDVTALLQRKGFPLARAYLPRQDLTAGELEIAVLQGRLESGPRRVQIDNRSGVPTARLQAIADAALSGPTLRTEDLERALLLMNDLGGVSARARLERGDAPGTSRLVVTAEATPAWRGGVGLDTFVNRYTGSVRASGRLTLANPLQQGDSLGLALHASEGNHGLAATYALPLGAEGLRLAAGASTLRYSIGRELAPLDLHGSAQAVNVGLSQPLRRSRALSSWVAADAEVRSLRDDSAVGNLRRRDVRRLQVSTYGSAWDDIGRGGSIDWSLAVTGGHVDLDGNAQDAAVDARTASTQGGYGKVSGQLGRLQALDAAGVWSAYTSLSAQLASHNLDSSEKFTLGGPGGLRAYAVGEGAGDSGWLLSAELRRDLAVAAGVRAQAIAFAEAGGVEGHRRPWAGAVPAGRSNHVDLAGVGVGLNLFGADWQLRAAVARGVGDHETRQADGRDAEGRRSRTRAWLQAGIVF